MRNKADHGVNVTENVIEDFNDCETQRVRLLYSTFLLDSNPDDPVYSRYISLASRIFKVPMAFLSLVDIDRTWLKSRSECEFIELPRMNSFCNYAIQSENNDVLVINDTLEDSRFCNIPIVIGSPYVRFYAGAPIIVNFMNIGTISIFDTQPNYDFNHDKILILQDISEAISYIITSRLQKILQLNNELSIENNRLLASNEKESFNKLKSFLMHNIRTPLMSIGLSSNLLESNFQLIANELTLINPSGVQVLEDTIVDLKTATKNLENIVSATLCWNKVSTTSVNAIDQSYHSENSLDKSFTICNIFEILRVIRSECLQLTTSYEKKISLQWFLMDDTVLLEGLHSSFPEILTIILHTLHEQILMLWDNISVYIHYLPNNISETSSLLPTHSFLSISENHRWHTSIFGQLYFQIVVSKQVDDVSPQKNNNPTPPPSFPSNSTSIQDSNMPLTTTDRNNNDINTFNDNTDLQETDEAHELSYDDIWTNFHRRIEFINNLLLEIKGTTPLTTLATTTTTTAPRPPRSAHSSVKLDDNVPDNNDINNNSNKIFSFSIPCNIINRRKVDDITTSSENSFDQLPSLMDKKIDQYNSINSHSPSPSSHDSSNSITIAQDNESNSDESSTSSSASLRLHLTHNNSLDLLDADNSAADRYSTHFLQNNPSYSLPPSASVVPSPAVSSHGLLNTPLDSMMRVLIIEDSKLIQRVLQRWLEAKHCLVTLADNGSAGLTLLTSRKFDITITDFVMPIMNGSDTLRLYKEWRKNYAKNGVEWNANMLIIGMSANATEKHQNAGFNYGMHVYTPKPIDLEIMTTILELRRTHREILSLMTCIKSQTNLRTCLDIHEAPAPAPLPATATAASPSLNTFSYLNASSQSVESLSEISLSEWSTASAAASASGHFHRRRTKKVFRSVLPEPFPAEGVRSSIDLPDDNNIIPEEKSSDNTPFTPPPNVTVKNNGRNLVSYFVSRVDRVRSNSVTMLTQSLHRNRTTFRFPRIWHRPTSTSFTSSSSCSSCCCFFWSTSSMKIESVVQVPVRTQAQI